MDDQANDRRWATSRRIGDDMNGNDNDFWGSTPDWTDARDRPHRQERSERGTDVTGVIKGLWNSAMSAGGGGTREHRVLDATTPLQADSAHAGIDSTMFDDLDVDFEIPDLTEPINATTEIPVTDATGSRNDGLVAFAPVPVAERSSRRVGSRRAIDPLLARIGAAAIVTTLLVPLAIGLSVGGDDDTIASADPAAAPTLVAAPVADGLAEPTSNEQPEFLDPDSLPTAVPVNPPTAVEASASELEPTTSADESSSISSVDEPTISTGASAVKVAELATDTSTGNPVAPVTEAASAGEDAERISNCAVDYTVVAGDFWLRLADAADVELAELLEANGATVNTALYPGSAICLPAGSTTPAPPTATTLPATTEPAPATTAPATTANTTPTNTTPTNTTVSNTSATPDEVKQIIRDVWPDELEERALEIAFRESRYVPTAKNFCCYGIFQIYWTVHDVWLVDIGITDDQQLYDPATNARAAYALYQRAGGWGPWAL
ncbi:MAG: LysM repeat protein [Ilumatobacter sp.]|jgi:LysM repeat protein